MPYSVPLCGVILCQQQNKQPTTNTRYRLHIFSSPRRIERMVAFVVMSVCCVHILCLCLVPEHVLCPISFLFISFYQHYPIFTIDTAIVGIEVSSFSTYYLFATAQSTKDRLFFHSHNINDNTGKMKKKKKKKENDKRHSQRFPSHGLTPFFLLAIVSFPYHLSI